MSTPGQSSNRQGLALTFVTFVGLVGVILSAVYLNSHKSAPKQPPTPQVLTISATELPNETVESVSWNHTGETLAAGTGTGSIYVFPNMREPLDIWEAVGRKRIDGAIYSTAWLPHSWQLASTQADGCLRLWDWRETTLTRTTRIAPKGKGAGNIASSPDGKFLVIGTQGGTTQVVDTTTGSSSSLLPSDFAEIMAVAWAPDNSRILTGSMGGIRVWQKLAKGWKLTGKLEESDNQDVWSLAYSPDGRVLAAGYKTVQALEPSWVIGFWSMPEGRILGSLKGHDGPITSLAWAHDGQNLYSGSQDKRVKVWGFEAIEPATNPNALPAAIAPKLLEEFLAPGLVNSLAISSHHNRLAVGMSYGLGFLNVPPTLANIEGSPERHPPFVETVRVIDSKSTLGPLLDRTVDELHKQLKESPTDKPFPEMR